MVYHVGQIVEGQITGIKPYGAFVSIDANTSGLIHLRVVRWFCERCRTFCKVRRKG